MRFHLFHERVEGALGQAATADKGNAAAECGGNRQQKAKSRAALPAVKRRVMRGLFDGRNPDVVA